jgi:transposase
MHLTALPVVPPRVATIPCDVSAYKLNRFCRELSGPGQVAEWEIDNGTEAITVTLASIREQANARGIAQLRVVVEPTGIYHRLILRIASRLGLLTGLVDAGHVKKMRAVIFGDDGKTDTRDPLAIEAVAAQGRLIRDRQKNETYQLLQQWGKLYHDAELAMIEAKCRVHRALTLLFPDFDFTTDFVYGPSGQALVRCTGLDPHVIAALDVTRPHRRLRKDSRILRSSVLRLVTQARQTVTAIAKSRVTDLQARELAFAWEDVELAVRRRETARVELEALYDEARAADPRLPDTDGTPISKAAFARLLGEAGPLSDYSSWRQLLRMAGLNLRERKSGQYVGLVRIARTGRPLIRAIVNQMALPLVKRDRMYGSWYHQKTGVQKMPGKKAMTAVGRKILKMIWGWYRSGAAFDQRRAFTSTGELRRVA